jgi:hypothetical protein
MIISSPILEINVSSVAHALRIYLYIICLYTYLSNRIFFGDEEVTPTLVTATKIYFKSPPVNFTGDVNITVWIRGILWAVLEDAYAYDNSTVSNDATSSGSTSGSSILQ